jgi:SAM-dependent methyltransferase
VSGTSLDALTSANYWDGVWQRKDGRGWGDLRWVSGNYPWWKLDRLLRRRLRPSPSTRFLEVGCASGKWLVYFSRVFGYQVTGCDYSEPGCQSARAALEAAGIAGSVLQQDLFALSGQYDVIFSGGLIEHFDRPDTVLAKLVSLLPPSGGTLITMVPNLGGLSGLYHHVLKPETFNTHRLVTLRDMLRWYGDLGLQDVEGGALGSVVPARFPREKIRRTHPTLYRALWPVVIGPVMWSTNRWCSFADRRWGIRLDSPRFSPYLYAIGVTRSDAGTSPRVDA